MSSKSKEAVKASTFKLSIPPVEGGAIADIDRAKKVPSKRQLFLAGKPFNYGGSDFIFRPEIGVSGIIAENDTRNYKASVAFVGGSLVRVTTYFFNKRVETELFIDQMEFLNP